MKKGGQAIQEATWRSGQGAEAQRKRQGEKRDPIRERAKAVRVDLPHPSDLPDVRTEIPGPRSRRLARLLKRHEAPTVTCMSPHGPVFWKRAAGIHVWDVDGNRFVDFNSGFGVASLGHSHPRVVAAIRRQSRRLGHAMGDIYPADLKAKLCARLSEITFERWSDGRIEGQTLLGNSGFEAVEAALKTARLFTRKRGVLAFEGGYHGLGYGALETTWRRDFREPFADQLGHFAHFAPYPRRGGDEKASVEAAERNIRQILCGSEIGAILVEPFQGRGGEVIPPDGFLPMLRRLCDRHRLLLIVDEVYVGFWRTGRWFGVEHTGVVPDIICLGKALSGSLPLSACVGRSGVMAAWPESRGEALHTSTFLGNPIACAAALASIREFEGFAPGWKVLEKGARLVRRLRDALDRAPGVKEVRGVGLMVGVEFAEDAPVAVPLLCQRLLARGIIALPSGAGGCVLVLSPPLTIGQDVLDWCAAQVCDVLKPS